MSESFGLEDYIAAACFFVGMIAIGIWSTCRPNRGGIGAYFLADKSMHWITIAAAMYTSNINSRTIIALAGTATICGFATAVYEWHGVFFLTMLGWVFMPVYIASRTYTVPEYLKKRFGGRRIHMFVAGLTLVNNTLYHISAGLYTGALIIEQVAEWNMYLSAALILSVTCIYNIAGGLKTVMYTNAIQAVVIITGAMCVAVFAFIEVGGMTGLYKTFPMAATNYSLAAPSRYHCGLPRDDVFHIWHGVEDPYLPWTGTVFGLSVLGLFAWCQDQNVVQLCLSAKNMAHAKAATLLVAFLKLFGFTLFIIPGMIARVLYTDDVACADPSECDRACGHTHGCSNMAYPTLILRLLPTGLKGLVIAAFCSSVVCSLTNVFHSSSSIITLDVWRRIRKGAREAELLIVGRLSIVVLCVLSMLWLPVLEQTNGSFLLFYLQNVCVSFIIPLSVTFLLGFFWTGMTEQAAFWGLLLCTGVGSARFILTCIYPVPICGEDESDNRPIVVSKIGFLHFATILSVVCALLAVVISVLTKPRPPCKLHRLTWSTRHNKEEPELSDTEEQTTTTIQTNVEIPVETKDESSNESVTALGMFKLCKEWLCGTDGDDKRAQRQTCVTNKSLIEYTRSTKWDNVLNVGACALWILVTFLFGYFG